jgi:GNAT superfamily N-acetyltransferase
MSYKPSFLSTCVTLEATSADVASAYQDLNRDMNPEFVHVFLDKIERYARKPDRALFLVQYKNTTIAFATIIDSAPVPAELSAEQVTPLVRYSCGTGLMVLPEYRQKGVASLLVEQWELWSRKKERKGIWVVTKKMDEWYQKHFSYIRIGLIELKGVKKNNTPKRLLSEVG